MLINVKTDSGEITRVLIAAASQPAHIVRE